MIIYQENNSASNYNYNIFIYEYIDWMHHFHKNFEFVYVIDGEFTASVDEDIFTVHKNEFLIIKPNSVHHFESPKYSKVWVSVFSKDFISDFADVIKGKKSDINTFCCTDNEMKYLNEFLLNENQSDIFTLKAGLYIIASRFLKSAVLTNANESYSDIAHKIINYTEENFQKDISLKDIANILGYEYHYLSRIFQGIFHTNFKTFLNQYRFEYAKNLILKSDKSLTSIAMESGFGSIRTFNRIYKEMSGTTPGTHRKN